MNNSILFKLQELFQNFFHDKSIQINEETTANDIHKWDSLTHLDLINEVEIQFNITFSFEEIITMKNVGNLLDLIRQKIN